VVGGTAGEYRAHAVLCARSMPRASSCGEAAQNNRMDRALHSVAAALAELDDAELHALIAATNRVPQTAPRLLAWIAGACDWELRRREGLDYPLQPPEAAIPPAQETAALTKQSICVRCSRRAPTGNMPLRRAGGTAYPRRAETSAAESDRVGRACAP
jgi:hypothetical protein